MPKVYNKRHGDAPADAVYVGRPSRYGNKFEIGKDGIRAEVIAKHKASLTPDIIADIKRDLKGKDLVCWCAPLSCHADTLLEIANEPDDVSNHVFSCALCSRQWTVHSTEDLECFFIGVCYLCLMRKGKDFREQISDKIRELAEDY